MNCLGIHDDWVLAIMTVYPGGRGLAYGAGLCQAIARQATGQRAVATGN